MDSNDFKKIKKNVLRINLKIIVQATIQPITFVLLG